MFKVLGIFMIILALVIGIVPQFSNCSAAGRSLELADGRHVPMKCHWTARAEIAVAAPLLLTGVLQVFTKRKETHQMLSIVSGVGGAAVIALPTILVGVCMNSEMICNSFMRPFLLLSGGLVLGVSAVLFYKSLAKKETVQWAASV